MELLLVYYSSLLLTITLVYINADCNISLKDDFPRPSPVFIKDGVYLAPNNTGAIFLRQSESLLVACTGTRRLVVLGNRTTNYDVVEAECLSDGLFQVNDWTGPIKEIKCNTQPFYTSQEVKGGCGRANKLYRVGYQIKEEFYPLYEACFDPHLLRTVYVKQEILPSSVHFHKDKHRPQFTEGGLFGKVKMSKVYAVANQKERINELLGPKESDKYVTKKEFLSRGHLAARADFSLRAEQVATFHYVNTAPQWQRGNAGDWAALEEGLKRRIHALGRPVTVYTGTHGVLSFEDGKELYLTTDANNNGIVPVPLYLYKLVYDTRTKKAVVFVTINSSFYNSSVTDQLTRCDDVCSRREFSWLTWRDDGTTSFCCSYEGADWLKLPRLQVAALFH